MEPTIHINASGGTDFYQQIAIFAYGSYVQYGFGATDLVGNHFPVGSPHAGLYTFAFRERRLIPSGRLFRFLLATPPRDGTIWLSFC